MVNHRKSTKSSELVSHPRTFSSKGRIYSGEAALQRMLAGTILSLCFVGFVRKM
jgi:hypothetical protein